jgi:hypothetical protein
MSTKKLLPRKKKVYLASMDQKSSVNFKGTDYIVTLDRKGLAWFSHPDSPHICDNFGQPGDMPLTSIEDAKRLVLEMLKRLDKPRAIH